MSKLSDAIKASREKQMAWFFNGGYTMKTNKYFTFSHVIDDDNIVIVTSNVTDIRDSKVLVVDNNKAVYLKDWQVLHVHSYYEEFNAYAVRLNRNFFKTYTFKGNIGDFSFAEADTFESLKRLAAEQDAANAEVALGWMK